MRSPELGRVRATTVSGVVGAGQKRRGRLGELTGGAVTTRPGLERGEKWRKGAGWVRTTLTRNRSQEEGGLRRARAWSNFSRVRRTSGTDAGAPDRANSARHRASEADRCDRTPVKPNWSTTKHNWGNRAWERVSHLEAKLRVARRVSGTIIRGTPKTPNLSW
jgi:hypothetical protein